MKKVCGLIIIAMKKQKKSNKKKIIVGFWIILIILAVYGYIHFDLSSDNIESFITQTGFVAPLVYIVLYSIRPLVFFPGTILTAISGVLFGPLAGILYTLIGANLSANLSFIVGRFVAKDWVEQQKSQYPVLKRFQDDLKKHGFVTVLIMRLIFLPFDIVSYVAGASPIRQVDFALATAIGILPGSMTFVLAGASFSDPRNLLLSAFFFVLGLVISKVIKRRKSLGNDL